MRIAFVSLLMAGIVWLGAAVPAVAVTVSYTYDSLGRVTQVTYDNGTTITYVYDAAGNRTSQVVTCSASGC
jgi:YD repeat-containing protein